MRKATDRELKAFKTPSFLCGNCSRTMCDDCKSTAEEYQELLTIRTRALANAQHELENTQFELEQMKRRVAMYEQVAKAGMPAVIVAWIDKEIGQLVKQDVAVGEDRLYKTAQTLLNLYNKFGPNKFRERFGDIDQVLFVCRQIVTEGEGNPHPWPGES